MRNPLVRTRGRHFALVGAATALGFLMHDFRYGPLSIAVIVLGRPMLSASVALWTISGAGREKIQYEIGWGAVALVAANVAALVRFVYETGTTLITDRLSVGIFVVSFVAQVTVFTLALFATALIYRPQD